MMNEKNFAAALARKTIKEANEIKDAIRNTSDKRPQLSETHVIDGQQANAPAKDEGERQFSDGLRLRVITSLARFITEAKHREDDCRGNLDNGSKGGYSEKLTEDINLLEELKRGQRRGARGEGPVTNDEAAYKKGFDDAKRIIQAGIDKLRR